MTSLPPYTGRTSVEVAAAQHDDGPQIPWGWMAILQIGAGAVVAFVLSTWALRGMEGGVALWPLLIAAVVGLVGGGVPFVAALVLHGVLIRGGREMSTETVAVAGGAVLGAFLLALPLAVFAPAAVIVLPLVIGVPSAVGFHIWVRRAWRHHPTGVGA